MIGPYTLAIAILAGGEGSRIGGGKPLVKLGGRSLIELAYERASSWSNTLVVCLRTPEQLGPYELPWIADAAGIEGPLAGLAAALEWAYQQGAPALLTIPCDMPFLPQDLPARLTDRMGNLAAGVASSGGELHPVCALWRSTTHHELQTYCATGRRSLRGFAEHVGYVEVEWPTAPRDPFFNINSPADFASAKSEIDR